MENYKAPDNISKADGDLELQKNEFPDEDEPNSLQKQNIDFYTNFEQIHLQLMNSSNDKTIVTDMIIFLSRFDKSFFNLNNNIIPLLIQSGTFEVILNHYKDLGLMILPMLKNMIHCQTENLILLLQNNLCDLLLYFIFNSDNGECQCLTECLSEIISRDTFFFVLIYSTNVLEIIFHYFEGINNENISNNWQKVCYYLTFLTNFFDKGPVPNKRISADSSSFYQKYQIFLQNCKNPGIFQKRLIDEFFNIGVDISSGNLIFHNILDISFKIAYKFKNDYIINNYLLIVFEIIRRNFSTFDDLFIQITFFDYFDDWIKLGNNLINYNLMRIVGCLFITSQPIPEAIVNECIDGVFYVFYRYIAKSEDLEYETITALTNLVCYLGWESKCVELICTKKVINKIHSNIFERNFHISRVYMYLLISVASNSKNCNALLSDDILYKIFDLMEKKKGNFIIFALDNFRLIFENEPRNKFMTHFFNCGGTDVLNELINTSEDEEIRQMAKIDLDFFENE